MSTTIDISPMQLVSNGRLPFPTSATNVTLNNATAANNVLAAICILQPGETITEAHFTCGGASVGTPTFNVSIEGVTNSGAGYGGRPNGTPLTSNGSAAVPMVVEDNDGAALVPGQHHSVEFPDSYTNNGTGPQLIAITIRTGSSGSGLDAANTITVRAAYQTWITNNALPHYSTLVSGSWVHTGHCPMLWASDAGGRVVTNTSNALNVTSETNWTSASSPNRRGVRWTAQFDCRLTGIMIMYRPAANSNHEFVVNVYESNGTTLKATGTATLNSYSSEALNPGQIPVNVSLPPIGITRGDVVRVFLKPDATANSVLQFLCLEWASSAQRQAFFNSDASDFQYTASSNGTTWTDTDTKFPLIIPIVDQYGSGSGGTVVKVRRVQIMGQDGRIAGTGV